jgi:hypothetical protein
MSLCGSRVDRRHTPFDRTWALELDAAAEAVLADDIAPEGDRALDLSGPNVIVFAGTDPFLALSRRMAADRCRLRITATSPLVHQVLHLCEVELRSARTTELFGPTGRASRVPCPCPGCVGTTRDTTNKPAPATPSSEGLS